jgi:starch phosphorylase
MSDATRGRHSPYSLLSPAVEGFDALAELALDMRWSWNHAADQLWRQLDPALWELTHNPWVVLQTVARDDVERVCCDPVFRKTIDELVHAKRKAGETPAWFQQSYPDAPFTCVAYFSMEFMLSEALPIYSGGLGNVAGDQLKAASDLGVPVIGVGLLYQQGYFRQVIDTQGAQQAIYPYNDPGQLPITPLREQNGEWLRLQLDLPGHPIWLRAWQVEVGRVRLYLLDSNDAANYPPYRGITSELYGGDPYQRLMQELILGIGGWRLLMALGLNPEVCHLNEGHAALAVLERARSYMQQTGVPFEAALAVTRAGNLFTTHTAVSAGFDRFSHDLVEHCLGGYALHQLGITLHDLLALGRNNPDDATEDFNMAYLAIRGSGSINGVSRLHGEVSRQLFAHLFPRWPLEEIPIGHVTNGVHVPSWDSAAADDLWTELSGKERWLGPTELLEQSLRRISDETLWALRTSGSKALVDYARTRLSRELAASGVAPEEAEMAKHLLDPDILTMGFARRFAAYKRPNLLLHDPERLLRILINPQRPVQLILAGKAHPADRAGQDMIRQWTHFIRHYGARQHVVFLADYDMLLTENLVQGVDVWLNTPRRPWEASGTSGMKVLVNGGLNLSELDGWWAEAYSPEVGWALGDGREHGDEPAWDAAEAEQLYDLLERQVIPEFYNRDPRGIPTAWVARMRESMALLTPQFSTNRVVREYTELHYLPAAVAYRARSANEGAAGVQIADWQRELKKKWPQLSFGALRVETSGGQHRFEVELMLNSLDPEDIRVELYAGGSAPRRVAMDRVERPELPPGKHVYGASVAAERNASDYTPRVIPSRTGLTVPLEAGYILWQR